MPKVTKSTSNNFVSVSYPVREAVLEITHAEHALILMFSHEKVKMIKFIRSQYNLGLYDAKQVVDTVIASAEAKSEVKSEVQVNLIAEAGETEVDWSKVKEGTWIYVKDCLYGDWSQREFIRYNPDSVFSFVCKDFSYNKECVWQRAKLISPM